MAVGDRLLSPDFSGVLYSDMEVTNETAVNGVRQMARLRKLVDDDGNTLNPAAPVMAAGEAHVGQVGGHTAVRAVTFTLDTSAYASGDLIAETQEITGAVRVNDGTAILSSIVLNDKDDQGVALYFVFLSANRTLGTENSAPAITDAHADDILGVVAVAATDYLDLGGTKVATVRGINLPVKGATGSTSIYVGIVNSTGTPTYTASGLVARFGFLQD